MPYNNYEPMPGQQESGRGQKKTIYNRWEGEGIVRPRSGNESDPIQFYAFPNGGGAIHVTVQVQEPSGVDPQTGQTRYETNYIPVNITTNRIITQQQVKNIRSGMRVRIVGALKYKSYTSKKTGQKTGSLEVNAFACDILGAVQQAAPQYMPQQGGYQQPPQYGPQQQYAPQQPGPQYAPQGGYQQPPQGYGQAQPQYNQPRPVQPGPQYVPAQPAQQQQQQQTPPPYYRPPQGAQPVDDLPPDDAAPVRPINI